MILHYPRSGDELSETSEQLSDTVQAVSKRTVTSGANGDHFPPDFTSSPELPSIGKTARLDVDARNPLAAVDSRLENSSVALSSNVLHSDETVTASSYDDSRAMGGLIVSLGFRVAVVRRLTST